MPPPEPVSTDAPVRPRGHSLGWSEEQVIARATVTEADKLPAVDLWERLAPPQERELLRAGTPAEDPPPT